MTFTSNLVDLYRKLRPLQVIFNGATDPLDHKDSLPLTVLTYNLLSQHHINSEVYPYCTAGILRSAYRRSHLQAELEAYEHFDVGAFQEVAQFAENWEKFWGRSGRRRSVYAAKEGGRDGICIVYDSERFSCAHEEVLSFAPLMNALEAVPNIAQILLLTPTDQQSPQLIVSNTHLFWRPDFDCLRVLQAHRLRKRIEEIRVEKEEAEAVVIMCGDWNSDPKSAVYHLITGKIDQITRSHWDQLIQSHSTLLKNPLEASQRIFAQVLEDFKKWTSLTSAYSAYRSPQDPSVQGEPPYTSVNSYIDTLDYIFVDARKLEVQQLLMLPAEEIVLGQTALPNEIYSSDHLALLAQFSFKKSLK